MRITLTEHIDAPSERVFEIFSDVASAPERIGAIKRVEVLTDGPVGAGTRFRETREMFGKDHTETLEFVAFHPPRSYGIDCESCGMLYSSLFTFTPAQSGTRVTMEMRSKCLTMKARLMSPMSLLFTGAFRKAMQKDLEELKRAAESEAAPVNA